MKKYFVIDTMKGDIKDQISEGVASYTTLNKAMDNLKPSEMVAFASVVEQNIFIIELF